MIPVTLRSYETHVWLRRHPEDFSRAFTFYHAITTGGLEHNSTAPFPMAYFVDEGGNQVGHLFQLEYLKLPTGQTIEFAASQSGPILYLEMANDLNDTLELVEKNGGHVLMPKSLVAPGKGYWALFLDTEGNRLALHSAH